MSSAELGTVAAVLEEWGIPLPWARLEQLDTYLDLMDSMGYPFTAVSSRSEFAVKHILDSLACLLAWDPSPGQKLIDVGTGAGLPGIPLKIARPELEVSLLDSMVKKTAWVRQICDKLGLQGTDCVTARAEELGWSLAHREQHYLVVARAVAPMSVLAELCLPLVRPGGLWVAMKGPRVHDELSEAAHAVAVLGGELERVQKLELPANAGRRALVVVRKASPTPSRYPRRPGVPQRRPLVP
jgi:16S rRNA (guanine527-N7)-methyltransferase